MSSMGLGPWLAGEWESQRSRQGPTLSDESLVTKKRLQYVQSLASTVEDGEELVWVRMADTESIIDVCLPSQFVIHGYNEISQTTFTSSGEGKDSFKLLSWKFVIACPPNPSRLHRNSASSSKTASIETLSRRVCLRIDELVKFGDMRGEIITMHKGVDFIEFRKHDRVRKTLEAVEHSTKRQSHGEVAYEGDLPNFATKSKPDAPPVPGPSKERLVFTTQSGPHVDSSRKSTSATHSSSARGSFDWSTVQWPPRGVKYSTPSRSDLELEGVWCTKKLRRVQNWKKQGKRIDPSLESELSDRLEERCKTDTEIETTGLQPQSGGLIVGAQGTPQRASSSKLEQLPTQTGEVDHSGTEHSAARAEQPKLVQDQTQIPNPGVNKVLSGPVCDTLTNSPIRNSSQTSDSRASSKPRDFTSEPLSRPKCQSTSGDTNVHKKHRDSRTEGEDPSNAVVGASQVEWDATPTPESLALAQNQARQLQGTLRRSQMEPNGKDVTEKITKSHESSGESEESDSAKEEDAVAQTLLSQRQVSQSQAKRLRSASPAGSGQLDRPPSVSSRNSNAPGIAARSAEGSKLPSPSPLKALPPVPIDAKMPETSPRLRQRSIRPLPSHPPITQETSINPSPLTYPNPAQCHASFEQSNSSVWYENAFVDQPDSTESSINITQQEEGFPKGGQQEARTFDRNVLRDNAVASSTASSSKSKRKRDEGAGKENARVVRGKAELDGEQTVKGAERISEKEVNTVFAGLSQSRARVEKTRFKPVRTQAGSERERTGQPSENDQVDQSLPDNKKRPLSAGHHQSSLENTDAARYRPAKKLRSEPTLLPDSPVRDLPAQGHPPEGAQNRKTRLADNEPPTRANGESSQEWNAIATSFAARKPTSPAGESAIEKMKRLRERRKRHEAALVQKRQALL